MGFIASGDHNGMGMGVDALWVKDFSREGILEAMRNGRCLATTGDRMIIEFQLNGAPVDSNHKTWGLPNLSIKVSGQRELEKIEVLRNSQVIKEFVVSEEAIEFEEMFADHSSQLDYKVLYYYIRATQKNGEIAWSSPIWVEQG